MAYGDEIYRDETLDQRAKRITETAARAAKAIDEALIKAQAAQDARDQLAEATAVMLAEVCYRVGAMSGACVAAQKRAYAAVEDLREATGRKPDGSR